MSSGYYCPTGQSSPNPFECEPGYYCERGSHNMTYCPAGTYQDETAQGACKQCNEGATWLPSLYLICS